MKKAFTGIVVSMWITFCQAANVLWDCVAMRPFTNAEGESGFRLRYYHRNSPDVNPSFWIDLPVTCTRLLLATTLTANYEYVVLMFNGNWVQASPGDVAMESTTRHLDEYFMHCWADDTDLTCSSTPLTVKGREQDLYLMFATRVVGENLHYNYGWVQLTVTPDEVLLVHSAINLDGEPIIVGTGNVPEPSSFLLLAVGGMLLSLRRRRFNAKRAKGWTQKPQKAIQISDGTSSEVNDEKSMCLVAGNNLALLLPRGECVVGLR